jgi:RNA recognition motif-containing protein
MSKKTCLFVEGIPTEVDNTTVIKIMKQYGSCYVNI